MIDPSDRIYVPNKTENVNLIVFNVIISTNESKILTKHISCACKCKFNGKKCNSNQKWSNDKRQCGCKNSIKHRVCEKDHV